MKRLELGHINIKDIQFGPESKIEDGVLYVDEEAVKAIVLEDERIKDCKLDIARPGESVRITPVKDVIEPRVKVEGRGGIFPGVISKVIQLVKVKHMHSKVWLLLQQVRSLVSRKVSSI